MRNTHVSLFAFLVLLVLSSCSSYFKQYYTDPAVCYNKALKHQPYDAIIVTGFPHHKDSMSYLVENRVRWATYLYKKGIAKNIIFSGGAVYTPYVEAEVMALYAEQMGIPKEHIFIENKAEHSIENLYYSCLMAKKEGFNSVALCTDPIQSSFIKSLNDHRFQIRVDYIPIMYDTLQTFDKVKPNFAQDSALTKNKPFVSIVERESTFKRFRGTRGKKVKELLEAEKSTTIIPVPVQNNF